MGNMRKSRFHNGKKKTVLKKSSQFPIYIGSLGYSIEAPDSKENEIIDLDALDIEL